MIPFPSTIQCVNLLLEQVPELRPAYDEHIKDYDDVLPHVFFGDVTRYVVQQIRSREIGPAKPVERILSFLEQCLASEDEQIRELAAISFIENLVKHDDVLATLRGLIGPNIEKELRNHGT